MTFVFSLYILISLAQTRSRSVPFISDQFKSNGDKSSPCFGSFLTGNA